MQIKQAGDDRWIRPGPGRTTAPTTPECETQGSNGMDWAMGIQSSHSNTYQSFLAVKKLDLLDALRPNLLVHARIDSDIRRTHLTFSELSDFLDGSWSALLESAENER